MSTRATCGLVAPGLQTLGPAGREGGRRSAFHRQAAASIDGHVAQAADRLALTRAQRAAAARDVRSAGTARDEPRPALISIVNRSGFLEGMTP